MTKPIEQLEATVERDAALLAKLPRDEMPVALQEKLAAVATKETLRVRGKRTTARSLRWFSGIGAAAACFLLVLSATQTIPTTPLDATSAADELDLWVSAFEMSREQLAADLAGYSLTDSDVLLDDWAEFDFFEEVES